MSLSPTQDLLDRIDRLHQMLVSDLPTLSPITSQPLTTTTILPRISRNPLHSIIKSESMIIDELQQHIKKMEREKEILLRSYSIILQLLKSNDIHNQINLINDDYSELLHND